MRYLVTAKQNGAAQFQRIMGEGEALNLARRAMVAIGRLEETSADLRAVKFLNEIKPGKARAIENTATGAAIVFQHDRLTLESEVAQ